MPRKRLKDRLAKLQTNAEGAQPSEHPGGPDHVRSLTPLPDHDGTAAGRIEAEGRAQPSSHPGGLSPVPNPAGSASDAECPLAQPDSPGSVRGVLVVQADETVGGGGDRGDWPAGVEEVVHGSLVERSDDATRSERDRIATAKRDALGFTSEAMPHITSAQLRWLTYRLESGDNLEACTASHTDPLTVLGWMGDAGFRATFEAALDNKREGFKTLTAHLLPSVIRSLQGMLDSGSNKDKKEAAALVLRAQGLLVDKTSVVDQNTVSTLFALLREERVIEARVLDMPSQRSFGVRED